MLYAFLILSARALLCLECFSHQTIRLPSRITLYNDITGSTSLANNVIVLKGTELTKTYTDYPQFQSISIQLCKGQRVGLIGINGAGKSTLLRCLARIDTPDSGQVEIASSCNIVYVDQEPQWGTGTLVYEALFAGDAPSADACRKYLSATNPSKQMDDKQFSDATDAMVETNAWEYQMKGLEIAKNLNIGEDKLYRLLSTLSGGEKKRVGLSAALLKEPDVLLLDEPTNHLDIDALEWLADYLRPGRKDTTDLAMLLVTHDRFFLERVCSEIVELDRASVYRYPGNYARYLELKADRIDAEDAEAMRARTKLRRESEWMAKQPRARQAKSKARQAQYYDLVSASKGRTPDLKKIELMTAEEKERQQRLDGVVAEFRSAEYIMGNRTLLQDFTYNFRQRDHIAIVGPNGVGKSTFLKILTGQVPLSSGSVRVGDTVSIGYYEQTGLNLTAEEETMPILKFVQVAVDKGSGLTSNENKLKPATPQFKVQESTNVGRRKRLAGKESSVDVQLQETVSNVEVAVSEREAMNLLTRFQFPAKRWFDQVNKMSGGERRRLQLLQILARKPNVLLLDEPSNDLDLSTLSALEEYLTEVFDGCIVVVSHDNFFVNRVAEHLFVFEGDGIVRDFIGSYTDYLDFRQDEIARKKEEAVAARRLQQKSTKQSEDKKVAAKEQVVQLETTEKLKTSSGGGNLSYNDRKEYNKLEKEIEKLTNQVDVLEKKIFDAGTTEEYSVLSKWTNEMNELKEKIQLKELRWMELAEQL